MKLVSLKVDGLEQAGIAISEGYVLVDTVNRVEGTSWSTNIPSSPQNMGHRNELCEGSSGASPYASGR